MYINQVSKYFVDNCMRTIEKQSTFGKYKDINLVVDNYKYKGNTIEKKLTAFGDDWQKIVTKVRNRDGKFERIG